MSLLSQTFTRQKLCIDFQALGNAAPKGVYVAPLPSEPLVWTGVLFVRKGKSVGPALPRGPSRAMRLARLTPAHQDHMPMPSCDSASTSPTTIRIDHPW